MPPLSATEAGAASRRGGRRLFDVTDDVAWDHWHLDVLYPLAKRGEEALLAVLSLSLWTSPDFYERQVAAKLLGDLAPASRGTLSRARELIKATGEPPGEPWTAAVATDIVAHADAWEEQFVPEALGLLTAMLAAEAHPCIVGSVVRGLGQLYTPLAFDQLYGLRQHSSASVRLMVAVWLPSCFSEPPEPHGVEALLALMEDSDGEVRDWATMELGIRPKIDSPAIRDALLARVQDTHEDTRCEALVGLARRRDARVLEPLIIKLSSGRVGWNDLEAAEELADPRLVPALEALRSWWPGDDEYDREL